jgi:hypothetical protein
VLMRVRKGLSLAVAILLLGAGAWAQGRRGGGFSSRAPGFTRPGIRGGASLHFRQAPPQRWNFGRREYRSGRPYQPFRGYGYYPSWNYSYDPYSYSGFGSYGYPFSLPYYGSPTGCDPRFSSPPFYCLPLYPHGPPDYGENGEGWGSGNRWNSTNRYDPAEQPAGPQPLGKNQGSSSDAQTSARDVQLTYDGHALPAGGILAVSSGKHQLVISGLPKQ